MVRLTVRKKNKRQSSSEGRWVQTCLWWAPE